MLCTSCNTCAGGAGNYSCGNSNDGAYIVDPTCGQTKAPKTPVDGATTHYGSDGKTPTSKTYPDGGKINYDSSGNPVSYTSPSGGTTPLDGPPGC